MTFASNMMLDPLTNNLGAYGYSSTTGDNKQYPLEHMSALGYLKSALRRPTVMEQWSPYEISVFEAAMAEYGKSFSRIRAIIDTGKTTMDVIEFYYIWKKTSHYKVWKANYVPEYLDYSDDDEEQDGKPQETPAKR